MFLASHGPAGAPPVLLVHGGGVAGWMWDSLTERLQSEYAVLIPDLPGHGRSADEPYLSHAQTVAGLARLLRDAAPDHPATVVGFSLGAQLAIRLAADHPELVSQAIIVSAQAHPLPLTGLTLMTLWATAPLSRARWFAKLQARELFIPAHLMEDYIATSAGITRATLLAAVGANLRFELPEGWSEFPGRALIMVGADERQMMRDSARSIHAALPGSELTIVEKCGHGLPFQRGEWFNDRVAELLPPP
jgi:pimeloyl-ACP methyl ester carboxylesterase